MRFVVSTEFQRSGSMLTGCLHPRTIRRGAFPQTPGGLLKEENLYRSYLTVKGNRDEKRTPTY
jgi:hypothetical protein